MVEGIYQFELLVILSTEKKIQIHYFDSINITPPCIGYSDLGMSQLENLKNSNNGNTSSDGVFDSRKGASRNYVDGIINLKGNN